MGGIGCRVAFGSRVATPELQADELSELVQEGAVAAPNMPWLCVIDNTAAPAAKAQPPGAKRDAAKTSGGNKSLGRLQTRGEARWGVVSVDDA